MAFIGIDFLSGVAASRAAARRKGHTWYFESCEAWRTVLKLGLTVTAIAMAWLIDSCILDFMQLNVARLFTGFTCGVELWSFLENAAQLSDAPLFHWLRRYVRRRIRKEAGGGEGGAKLQPGQYPPVEGALQGRSAPLARPGVQTVRVPCMGLPRDIRTA